MLVGQPPATLDSQQMSSFVADESADGACGAPLAYVPPLALVLQGLDVTEMDFHGPRVSVSAPFLRFVLGEMARAMPFDASYYGDANPDVEAARLAGDVSTLHEHFVAQGYFERRQPHALPFDAFYYVSHYDDLAAAFNPKDALALHTHYQGYGWQEGRAGVSWQRADADRWVHAARASAPHAAG